MPWYEFGLLTSIYVGLVIGSYLNVCIYRIPRNQSIHFERSNCPFCRHKLGWLELIPVFSYLIQKGKCKQCGNKISPIYPAIELITAGIFIAIYLFFQPDYAKVAQLWILASFLLVLFVIDLQHLILPNSILLTAFIILGPWITIERWLDGGWQHAAIEGMAGAFIGTLVLGLFHWYSRGKGENGQDAMGFGDVKYMTVFGYLVGIEGVFWILLLSTLGGSLYALAGMILGKFQRKTAIPFGPFLTLATFVSFVYFSA